MRVKAKRHRPSFCVTALRRGQWYDGCMSTLSIPRREPAGTTDLGDILRRHRQALGLSQRLLARQSGLDPSTVRNVENGSRSIGPVAIAKLGKILGIDFISEMMTYFGGDDGED